MVCAIAAVVVGCAGPADDAGPESNEPPREGQLRLAFHAGNGDAPGGIFSAKDDVYLRTSIDGDGAAFAGAELAFVVVDAQGRQASADPLDCRRFRIEGDGAIVAVLTGYDVTGAPCRHATSVHASGSTQLQLAPFTDVAPNADGLMEYAVVVARAEHIVDGAFPADAPRGSVVVEPEEDLPSVDHCGGGGGGSPVCGNGVVEAGEGCDDGDTDGGDGCSPSCQIEVIP